VTAATVTTVRLPVIEAPASRWFFDRFEDSFAYGWGWVSMFRVNAYRWERVCHILPHEDAGMMGVVNLR